MDNFAPSKIGSYSYSGTTYAGADLGAVVQKAAWFLTGQANISGYGADLANYLVGQAKLTDVSGMASKYQMLDLFSYNNGIRVENQNLLAPVPIPPTVFLFGSGLLGLMGFGVKRQRQSEPSRS
jgi:hypothetical protein